MTEAEAAAIRAFLDWLANRSLDFYVCESVPGYDDNEFRPLRDDDGGVARLMAAYAKHQNAPPEPPTMPFTDSMIGKALTAYRAMLLREGVV